LQRDKGKKMRIELIVLSCHAAKMLESTEKPLDEVAAFAPGRNQDLSATAGEFGQAGVSSSSSGSACRAS